MTPVIETKRKIVNGIELKIVCIRPTHKFYSGHDVAVMEGISASYVKKGYTLSNQDQYGGIYLTKVVKKKITSD